MDTREFILAALAPANGAEHTPVQVQKLFFVLQKEIPAQTGESHFNFEPYDYGPFDVGVYRKLEELSQEGMVEIIHGKWNSYRLTNSGQEKGKEILEKLDSPIQEYIVKLSQFVRSLSFSELVSTIYKAYPDMKANSVFQE